MGELRVRPASQTSACYETWTGPSKLMGGRSSEISKLVHGCRTKMTPAMTVMKWNVGFGVVVTGTQSVSPQTPPKYPLMPLLP